MVILLLAGIVFVIFVQALFPDAVIGNGYVCFVPSLDLTVNKKFGSLNLL